MSKLLFLRRRRFVSVFAWRVCFVVFRTRAFYFVRDVRRSDFDFRVEARRRNDDGVIGSREVKFSVFLRWHAVCNVATRVAMGTTFVRVGASGENRLDHACGLLSVRRFGGPFS